MFYSDINYLPLLQFSHVISIFFVEIMKNFSNTFRIKNSAQVLWKISLGQLLEILIHRSLR